MRWWMLVVICGCVSSPAPAGPAPVPDEALLAHLEALSAFPELRLETDHGTIRTLLYSDWLPQTVDHVGGLARDGFYDATTFHRVVDDFVIQGGDPTGTGEGGSGPLGTPDPVPLEIHAGLDFGSGAVGLARWTDDTGDSQYFITEKPALHLSRPDGPTGEVFGAYALFGQVFDGLDVVRSIAAVETLPSDRPVEDVVVHRARVLGPPEADLIGLIPDVVDAWQDGVLEYPRHLVAGHPATFRFTADAPCQAPALSVSGSANATPWQTVQHDTCTFEAQVAFPAEGAYTIQGDQGGDAVEAKVLAWHDAYLPFAGPAATL